MAAMKKGLDLRPGTTAMNVALPDQECQPDIGRNVRAHREVDPDPPNWSMLRAIFSGILNPMEGGCHETEAVFGGADCLCTEAG